MPRGKHKGGAGSKKGAAKTVQVEASPQRTGSKQHNKKKARKGK